MFPSSTEYFLSIGAPVGLKIFTVPSSEPVIIRFMDLADQHTKVLTLSLCSSNEASGGSPGLPRNLIVLSQDDDIMVGLPSPGESWAHVIHSPCSKRAPSLADGIADSRTSLRRSQSRRGDDHVKFARARPSYVCMSTGKLATFVPALKACAIGAVRGRGYV